MSMSDSNTENEFAATAAEMKIPMQMDNKDYGKKTKIVARKVVTRSSSTGKVYGSKTIMTKEGTPALTFIDFLLNEGDDITALPEKVFGEIKSNISKGANDLQQNWKNALELVHKAYQVSNVRRPTPDQRGAWKQYEQLIQAGVSALTRARGIDGEWRTSKVLVRETMHQQSDNHIGKRRFFVEIPGHAAVEADSDNMDDIIEQISNKIRNSREVKGTKVRIEERTKTHAILTIWVHGIKRDRITIKAIS